MSSKIIILFLLAVLAYRCFAQEERKKTDSNPEKMISAYIDSAKTYLPNDPQRSLYYTHKLLELSIAHSSRYGELTSYKLLGNINYAYGRYDLAIDYYNKIITHIKSGYSTREFYDVYKLLGLTYKAMNQTSTSRQHFDKYLEHARQYNDSLKMSDATNNIASLYIIEKKYDEAIQLSQQSTAMNQRSSAGKSPVKASDLMGNNNALSSNVILSKAYYLKGEKEKAYSQLSNTITQEGSSIPEAVQSRLSNSISDMFFKSDSLLDKVSAQNSFITPQNDQFLDLNMIVKNKATYELGNQYLSTNNTKSAIPYLEESVRLTELHGTMQEKLKSVRTLAEAYEKAGLHDKATYHFKKYARLLEEHYRNDEMQEGSASELNVMLDNINRKVQLLEREKEVNTKTIELLTKEQQLKSAEVDNRNRIIYGMIGFILLLVIVGYYMVRTVQQKRKSNMLLELKSLRTQMNPHFIFNALNSVNNFISQNDERTANRFLSSFSTLTRSILHNAEADLITLGEEVKIIDHYLKLEHERFSDKFDYSFTLHPELDLDQVHIPPMLVQPFIENAIWHGLRYLEQRGRLEVDIRPESNKLVIAVKDNGIGREQSLIQKTKNQKNYRSTGIRNIAKRIDIINQVYKQNIQIDISDLVPASENANTGTSVKITIAIKNN